MASRTSLLFQRLTQALFCALILPVWLPLMLFVALVWRDYISLTSAVDHSDATHFVTGAMIWAFILCAITSA